MSGHSWGARLLNRLVPGPATVVFDKLPAEPTTPPRGPAGTSRSTHTVRVLDMRGRTVRDYGPDRLTEALADWYETEYGTR